ILRRRFADVIERQLRLFAEEHAELIQQVDRAERIYDRADREQAEYRYSEYADLVEEATEILADLRDHFASTLDEPAEERYCAAFNRAVLKRWPPFALEIENR